MFVYLWICILKRSKVVCAHARVHMYCTHYVSVVKSFPQIEFGTQWFLKTDQSKYVGMQWFQPLYKCDHFSQSGEKYNLEWVGDPFLLRVFLHQIFESISSQNFQISKFPFLFRVFLHQISKFIQHETSTHSDWKMPTNM